MILEDKIEAVFGSCFSTHGLGGVLTCGVIGMGAGLSHSPVENVSAEGLLMTCSKFGVANVLWQACFAGCLGALLPAAASTRQMVDPASSEHCMANFNAPAASVAWWG